MELTIMYQSKSIKKIHCERVFIAGNNQYLYYEQHADGHGNGVCIPLSDIRAWEVNTVIIGGSQNLIL